MPNTRGALKLALMGLRNYIALGIPFFALFVIVSQIVQVSISDIEHWKIGEDSSLVAEFLWQKSIPCLTPGYTTSHGAVAVSNSQVVFNYGCVGIDNNFVALNLQTGKLEWKSPGTQSFQVTALENGYLTVFGDSYINKLDYTGKPIWESEKFPSRAMRAIYTRDDVIYAPFETRTDKGVYILSQQTGEILDQISDRDLVVVLKSVTIRTQTDNLIDIVDTTNGNVLWSTDMPVSPYAAFTNFEQVDDVLLIYFGQEQIDAFNIYTGNKLWSLKQDYASYPLVVKGLLVLYGTDDVISVLDIRTGQPIGTIKLERINTSATDVPTTSVAIGGNEGFLTIAYRNRNEVINLELPILANKPT